ncbi:conserved hypothetical protein [Trichormus variabilis ATCC 29413]|uniref:Uncharacterized protein n=2 Tax=Anabaena variabilis TaxID=264691 RepID=Q3MCS4_TRIV2|nr:MULTISPECIES: hypothetical protein [Nostocaceae]ABA21212.1 conserved hypothetical protein [Trichormus variabilis ATCC 29413]MBC1214143.1 hypothetical protein [Trichormus variabilis ARAD]MBC1257366.1 hypothetical protein [Trichormus variabilis V5]MBC1267800.1 hypothetical protein [Trichormus variabilis FSR]MBC1303898.1 hypothetical protein [Trichormus variabilis N2B]
MDEILERSHELKQALMDFVLDAEGDIAQALETYAAERLRRGSGDNTQQDLTIDSFLIEGKVGDESPLNLFIASQVNLSQSDRHLLNSWHRSFMGLFAISQILPDGLELLNWLTNKSYIVKPNNSQTLQAIERLKIGEILLTRISPVTDNYWTFSSPYTLLGKLGKPKLAVAIGNFKENYKNHLYSDAPDVLEAAWNSVYQYHQDFIDFFGSDEITLPGYQLNKKIAEFQELITEKRLADLGIDQTKSLSELAIEAGVQEEDIQAAVKETGADAKLVSQILNNKSGNTKMVMPKVDLPAELKKAEQVTAISHPRWGQMFLPTYNKFQNLLSTEDWQSVDGAEKLVRYYLENKNINAFIWHRLAEQYPSSLEKVLQVVLQRPGLKISNDLDAILQEFNKPLEPDLPDIASVPIHLHELFQEAVAEVHKSKPKGKIPKKAEKGFK